MFGTPGCSASWIRAFRRQEQRRRRLVGAGSQQERQATNKVSLTRRVLADQHDHGPGVEVCVLHGRGLEVVEEGGLLERADHLLVALTEAIAHVGIVRTAENKV